MRFRRDINGLRAVAVLGVLIFHFAPTLLPGGFAGVDVFFVISGYLMTSIICRRAADGRFSLWDFYLARVRRIVPALLVLVAGLLAFGWFYFSPFDYRILGKHAAASVGFVSNMAYWEESGGYFDAISRDKWLLHTWSLSVEWQFYLVYPLVLLPALRALGDRRFRRAYLVAAGVAFAGSAYVSGAWPSAAFYWFPPRAWEMMLGGLAFLWPLRSPGRARMWLGLGLIACAFAFLSEGIRWPGYAALLPTLGTYLVITSGQQTAVLNNRVAQWLGEASYSIYLWHWPFAVLLHKVDGQTPSWLCLAGAASLVLGRLSYRLVERASRAAPQVRLNALAVTGAVLLLGAAVSTVWADGLAERSRVGWLAAAAPSPLRDRCNFRWGSTFDADAVCEYFEPKTEWAVYGDSHAIELAYALARKLQPDGIGLRHYSYSNCIPALDVESRSRADCVAWTHEAFAELLEDERIQSVVLVYRYGAHFFGGNVLDYAALPDQAPPITGSDSKAHKRERLWSSFAHMVRALAERKQAVYVLLPVPELERSIHSKALATMLTGGSKEAVPGVTRADYLARNGVVRDTLAKLAFPHNVHRIDPADAYCDERLCYAARHGVPLYFDHNHPSVAGAAELSSLILAAHAGASSTAHLLTPARGGAPQSASQTHP